MSEHPVLPDETAKTLYRNVRTDLVKALDVVLRDESLKIRKRYSSAYAVAFHMAVLDGLLHVAWNYYIKIAVDHFESMSAKEADQAFDSFACSLRSKLHSHFKESLDG